MPASGFWEPEKPAREKGVAPWSYYSMKDGRPFFMAGLWAEAHDPATGEVADTYTVIITDANAAMRVHDRMPVILATDAARRWIEPGPLPAEGQRNRAVGRRRRRASQGERPPQPLDCRPRRDRVRPPGAAKLASHGLAGDARCRLR